MLLNKHIEISVIETKHITPTMKVGRLFIVGQTFCACIRASGENEALKVRIQSMKQVFLTSLHYYCVYIYILNIWLPLMISMKADIECSGNFGISIFPSGFHELKWDLWSVTQGSEWCLLSCTFPFPVMDSNEDINGNAIKSHGGSSKQFWCQFMAWERNFRKALIASCEQLYSWRTTESEEKATFFLICCMSGPFNCFQCMVAIS